MGTFAGKYDRLLSLFRAIYTQSGTGQTKPEFEEYVTEIPCQEVPRNGGDSDENNQRVAYNTTVFRIHYPHSFEVLETMELEYEGNRYKIDNVREAEKGRRVELEITATKKDNQ
jgi:SPP1 family predicted phage head-tail adaptor